MPSVVFYVSGHGFGHASRQIELINALRAGRPSLPIVVRTAAPRWMFDLTIRSAPESPAPRHEPLETDTGVIQIDSLHLDEAATVRAARAFMRTFDARVHAEASWLRREDAALIVADIPALAIAAGRAAGIPVIAVGNFTWDWIYAAYPGTADLVAAIGDAYARADLALRLPMHGGFERFPAIVDLPFIARRSARSPRDTRAALGAQAGERLVLVSFGGYGLDKLDLTTLSRLEGYTVLTTGTGPTREAATAPASGPRPLVQDCRGSLRVVDEAAMYQAGLRYEDLVAAVDVVVTKPGYGIIAECLANDTALLYTPRGHFVEYDVLVAEMPRFLRTAAIDHDDLFAGAWRGHLDALVAQPPPPARPAVNGAEVAAKMLLAML